MVVCKCFSLLHQDSNSVATFRFNPASGEMKFTGTNLKVDSPNFVACLNAHMKPDLDGVCEETLTEAKSKIQKTLMKFRGGSESARGMAPQLHCST